jgi:hypothetical protein
MVWLGQEAWEVCNLERSFKETSTHSFLNPWHNNCVEFGAVSMDMELEMASRMETILCVQKIRWVKDQILTPNLSGHRVPNS